MTTTWDEAVRGPDNDRMLAAEMHRRDGLFNCAVDLRQLMNTHPLMTATDSQFVTEGDGLTSVLQATHNGNHFEVVLRPRSASVTELPIADTGTCDTESAA